MNWIKHEEPPYEELPAEDMMCLVVRQRGDGSTYYDMSFYTIGMQEANGGEIFSGFNQPNIIAWMPMPKSYIKDRVGWNPLKARLPKPKDEIYIVTIQKYRRREEVILAAYDAKQKTFNHPDVIAWMEIPQYST